MGIVDELEGSLQELEESTSGTAASEPSRNTPRWAGSVRSRRLEFLANLCENKDYQDILVRLREFPVGFLVINTTGLALTFAGYNSIRTRRSPSRWNGQIGIAIWLIFHVKFISKER